MLRRVRDGRILGGVCGGLARSMGWDATLVRALFALLTLASFGFGLLLYVVAWLVTPSE